MDFSVIFNNENRNDGSYAHCYFNSRYGTWLAYGKSAYVLRLLVKSVGDDNLRSHSKELELPCSMVGDDTIKRVMSNSSVSDEVENVYICLQVDTPINIEDYNNWKDKLKEESKSRTQMWVDTPVSRYIPRGEYIADGMSGFSRNTKRLFDMFVAFIALIIFSPLFLITYICVKREDGGPAIFKQERVGRFGRPFYIYKFRSMRLDAEKFGPQLSHSGGDDDPRLTKVGKFIRAHHIDELPQLINVFLGDMYLVGPRPHMLKHTEEYSQLIDNYMVRHFVKPGITGWAQVTGFRGETKELHQMEGRVRADIWYMEHWSFLLDLNIIYKTFANVIQGEKNAY